MESIKIPQWEKAFLKLNFEKYVKIPAFFLHVSGGCVSLQLLPAYTWNLLQGLGVLRGGPWTNSVTIMGALVRNARYCVPIPDLLIWKSGGWPRNFFQTASPGDNFLLTLLWPVRACCAGLSPVLAGGGCSLGAVRRLLVAAAPAEKRRLSGARASVAAALGLWGTVSAVMVSGLGCSVARGIFLAQGSNPRLLHWQVVSLPLGHQEIPLQAILIQLQFL